MLLQDMFDMQRDIFLAVKYFGEAGQANDPRSEYSQLCIPEDPHKDSAYSVKLGDLCLKLGL